MTRKVSCRVVESVPLRGLQHRFVNSSAPESGSYAFGEYGAGVGEYVQHIARLLHAASAGLRRSKMRAGLIVDCYA